ncbi:MAG: hypothetical protein OXH09_07130 [Gammaproteobacteria bacterium]|nr:hypothetical protein [Gammaproteobacteria bacterium]
MAALNHLKAVSSDAGVVFPAATMLTADGVVEFWTPPEVDELVTAVAGRKNAVESARNVMRSDLRKIALTMQDVSGGKAATASREEKVSGRVAAFDRIFDRLAGDNVFTTFGRALSLVENATLLPRDLGRAQARLTHMLEAIATGRQKRLKGALTQQAIDNWAACVDMDKALAEVAKQCALGTIEIERATSIDSAKAAYDVAAAAVTAVTAANTPHWQVGGTTIPQSHPAGHQDAGSKGSVTIRAHHPAGKAIEGKAAIRGFPMVRSKATGKPLKAVSRISVPSDDSNAHEVLVTLDQEVTEDAHVTVSARNLCGPSEITVLLRPAKTPVNPA